MRRLQPRGLRGAEPDLSSEHASAASGVAEETLYTEGPDQLNRLRFCLREFKSWVMRPGDASTEEGKDYSSGRLRPAARQSGLRARWLPVQLCPSKQYCRPAGLHGF
jgi:hypothetical protein